MIKQYNDVTLVILGWFHIKYDNLTYIDCKFLPFQYCEK